MPVKHDTGMYKVFSFFAGANSNGEQFTANLMTDRNA